MSNQTPTDALRLVPSMPTVEMTDGMLFKIETGETVTWGELKRRQYEQAVRNFNTMREDGSLAAPASPLPEGGGDDPHERWGIINHLGTVWTDENFGTERQARSYLERWQDRNPKIDLSGHKVIPVLITITAAPTGEPK